jgi:RNA polymerase-binding transcription factor DksA
VSPIGRGQAGPEGRDGERQWFRTVIEADRAATRSRVRSLRSEIDGIVAAVANANTDDEHDPEGATIAFERARASALLEDALSHLSELDRADGRVEAGTHATCEQCGGPITQDRLAARPASVTCIGCAAASSVRGGVQHEVGRPLGPSARPSGAARPGS